MKKSITSLILGIAAAAAFPTATAADTTSAGTSFPASADVKEAAPAPNEPVAETEKAAEEELMLQGMPDVLNRPER